MSNRQKLFSKLRANLTNYISRNISVDTTHAADYSDEDVIIYLRTMKARKMNISDLEEVLMNQYSSEINRLNIEQKHRDKIREYATAMYDLV